jgi:hypothetical protein
MRVIITDWEMNVYRNNEHADGGVPRVGDHITLKEGRYKVVQVTWMYDLDTPNVTVEVIEDPWEGKDW